MRHDRIHDCNATGMSGRIHTKCQYFNLKASTSDMHFPKKLHIYPNITQNVTKHLEGEHHCCLQHNES